jgi:hypothetical protein
LRIVASYSTVSHHGATPRAGIYPRSTEALQLRDPACMVEVDVRVHDDLHILNTKPKGTNVSDNLCSGLGQSAVDQDVSASDVIKIELRPWGPT